jgi:hypothetical protein
MSYSSSSSFADVLHHSEKSTLWSKLLSPLRNWLDTIEITDAQTARLLCKLIPAQCPFERDIKVWGHKIFRIPPMCQLNPVYDQLMGLRFRALCYLADVCGEFV